MIKRQYLNMNRNIIQSIILFPSILNFKGLNRTYMTSFMYQRNIYMIIFFGDKTSVYSTDTSLIRDNGSSILN